MSIPTTRCVSLIITQACNLNCVYCYEKHKSNRSMEVATAKAILRCEFARVARSDRLDDLRIDFFGGEPFLEAARIIEVCEWLWENDWPNAYRLYVPTNGTVLDESTKRWLREHREKLSVSLSVDGDVVTQRVNRGCHLGREIDLEFFRVNWPDQPVKATISRESVHRAAESIIHLLEYGFQVQADCGTGMFWDEAELAEYARQLHILGEYYLAHQHGKPIRPFTMDLARVLSPPGQDCWCGTMGGQVAYDIDGRAYACYLLTPMVLGAATCETLDCFTRRPPTEADIRDPHCVGCVIRNICSSCYALNHQITGNIALRDPTRCQLMKIQALACCWFHTRKLATISRALTRPEAEQAKAILKIQRHLQAGQ